MAARETEGEAATGHPLLRVLRRDKYTHGLRPVQMEALRAMCGALIPSLQPEQEALDGRVDPQRDKDLERFYLASGADSTIPDEVAELAFTRCVWEGVVLVHVTLWLLCTRLGTLALCGRLCVSGEFPYVRRFAEMPVDRREEALKRWTGARWFIPVKIAFAIVKSLCLNVFYTTPAIRGLLEFGRQFLQAETEHDQLQGRVAAVEGTVSRVEAEKNKVSQRLSSLQEQLDTLHKEKDDTVHKEAEARRMSTEREEQLAARLCAVAKALSTSRGTSLGLAGQLREDELLDSLALVERHNNVATTALKGAGESLKAFHESMFPKDKTPSMVSSLVEALSVEASALGEYSREQIICGIEATLAFLLVHGVQADYEKILSGFPKD